MFRKVLLVSLCLYFVPKSTWKPPIGHPALELYLSDIERELLDKLPGVYYKRNMHKEEWIAMRYLAEDCSIIIKPADKGF